MTSTTQNAPATIESTVENALVSAGFSTYLRQAQPVVQALVEREQAIAEKLLDYAGDAGASTDEVTELLTSLGVSLKPEEPEVAETAIDDPGTGDNARIASALERIEQRLDSLTAFARNNGYRG